MPRKPRHVLNPAITVAGIGYQDDIGDFAEVELVIVPEGGGRVTVVALHPDAARELANRITRECGVKG